MPGSSVSSSLYGPLQHAAHDSAPVSPKELSGAARGQPAITRKTSRTNKRDRNVVEQCRLRQIRPELVGCPEQKCRRQHDRLHQFHRRWPMRHLVNQVGESDHRQGKSGEKLVAPSWKQSRKRRPRPAAAATPASVTDPRAAGKSLLLRSSRMFISHYRPLLKRKR